MSSEDELTEDFGESCADEDDTQSDEERAYRRNDSARYSRSTIMPLRKRKAIRGSGYSDDEEEDEAVANETSAEIIARAPNQEHFAREIADRDRARSRAYRCRGKAFFLTYPKCDVSLLDVRTHMQIIFGIDDISFMRIASEQHADGSLHRHVFVMTRDVKMFYHSGFADLKVKEKTASGHSTKIYHGNYQVARSQIKAFEYVSKKGEFVDFGTVPSSLMKKSAGKLDKVAGAIEEGASANDIRAAHPGFFLMNRKKVEDMVAIVRRERMTENLILWDTKKLEPVREALCAAGAHDSTLAVFDWLMKNINTTRKFKQKQLYLHSPPNHGKTTLVQILSKFVSVFDAPMGESFFDQFDECVHKLVFFDEFKGQHTVTFMNKFLEMSVMNIKVKGGQILRSKNIPVIIGSNLRPEEAYHKVHESEKGTDYTLGPILAGFAVRVEYVHLTEPLFGMIKFVMNAFSIVDDTLSIE